MHQNIALLYFHIQIFSAHDTLVVIVHSHRQRFFRFILSDDIFIQKILDLHRFLKIVADQILRTKQKLNEILAANTGQPLERIAADTDRDNYMTAEEAKEYGLIDELVKSR